MQKQVEEYIRRSDIIIGKAGEMAHEHVRSCNNQPRKIYKHANQHVRNYERIGLAYASHERNIVP